MPLHSFEVFEIRVTGRLDAAWLDFIDADEITCVKGEEGSTLTILTLRGADQSMLIGTINSLFTLGMPLVSVQRIHASSQALE